MLVKGEKMSDTIRKDDDGNCEFCGQECWKDGGQMCDEQQADGFVDPSDASSNVMGGDTGVDADDPNLFIVPEDEYGRSEFVLMCKREGVSLDDKGLRRWWKIWKAGFCCAASRSEDEV
jgi:hypothetical protein